MDLQDFAILTALRAAPRAPTERVGQRVGLTANAVKARLARLERDGVLQGFVADPDPALLGLREGALAFSGVDDAAEREDELLRGLPDIPGVRAVDVGIDHTLLLWLAFRDDADWERIERAAISLVGKPPAWRHAEPRRDVATLSPADWRLVEALAHDGRAPMKDVAAASGISFKTARRRVEALLASGHVRIEPVLSPTEAQGQVLSAFVVQLAEGAAPPNLPGALVAPAWSPRLALLHTLRPSLRAAQADLRALRAASGVESAHHLVATRRVSPHWPLEAIRERDLARPALVAPVPVRTR